MREIKFRAKLASGEIIYSDDFLSVSVFFDRVSAEGLEVEQFICRHDKNGKEIYEGDRFKGVALLSPDGISSAHNITFWVPVECTIVFHNSSFVGSWEIEHHREGQYVFTNRQGKIAIPAELEIITNIHEEENNA